MQVKRFPAGRLLLAAALTSQFPLSAGALDWKLTPSVSASAALTDNVSQSRGGDAALVLSLTPGVDVQSEGSRRVQARLNYGLGIIERLGGNASDQNDINHRLNASGKAEIAEDFFFVEGTANISQALGSLLGAPGDGNLDTGNSFTAGAYSISPYLTRRLGTFATGILRYRRSGAIFEDSANVGNIAADSIEATLNSGTQFKDLMWGLNYSLRNSATSNGTDTRFESYGATLGYALTRKFRLKGSYGYDKNDYPSLTKTEGDYWSAGFEWMPSRRTQLETSYGKRYYGNDYNLRFNHRTRHTQWNLQYQQSVSDIAQQLLNPTAIYAWLCDDGVWGSTSNLFPPAGKTGCVLSGIAPPGTIPLGTAQGIYINKTLRGGTTWSVRKLTFAFDLFDTTRIYQDLASLPEDRSRGFQAGVIYNLAPHTKVNAALAYTHNEVAASLISPLATARSDDLYTLTAGVDHQFNPKLKGSLLFRHQQRESSNAALADFTENSLTATVTMQY